jgi:hypothetical protein
MRIRINPDRPNALKLSPSGKRNGRKEAGEKRRLGVCMREMSGEDHQSPRQGLRSRKEEPNFKPLKNGTNVTWHYRSAIGHGTIKSVYKMGTNYDNTMYNIKQHDYHISKTGSKEPAVVHHYGRALTVAK